MSGLGQPRWVVLVTQGCVCVCVKSLQLCLTLCNPMDCSPPDFSVHGILWATNTEWVAMSSSRGSFWPRDGTQVTQDYAKAKKKKKNLQSLQHLHHQSLFLPYTICSVGRGSTPHSHSRIQAGWWAVIFHLLEYKASSVTIAGVQRASQSDRCHFHLQPIGQNQLWGPV